MSRKKKQRIKTRDHLLVKVINGATKSGAHKDHKKESNKLSTREKVENEDDFCWQCGFSLWTARVKDYFCSESCHDYFHETSYGDTDEET